MEKQVYVILSKHDSRHYFVNALGHEIHISRFILFDLLQKNVINLDSTIVTLYDDRFFLYSKIFRNLITWDDYVTNHKKETNIEIDLTHYSYVSTQNEQIKEFDEINYKLNNFERTEQFINYINDINFYDLTSNDEYLDIIQNKFILLHMRSNIINKSSDYVIDVSTNYIDNHLFKIINRIRMYSNLKIVIFTSEKQNIFLENVFFINNLQIYASFLNNKNCDLFITEWSGGGQLSQYCCNSKIIYYFNNYISHDYELLYETYQNESNKEQNIFFAWDFKSTTCCERIYYKNLDIFLENIYLYV